MSPRVECYLESMKLWAWSPPALPDNEHDGACLSYTVSLRVASVRSHLKEKRNWNADVRLEPPYSAEYVTEHLPSRGERVRNPCLFRKDHLQSQHPHVCLWSPVFLVTLVLKRSWRRTLQCFLPDWINKLSEGMLGSDVRLPGFHSLINRCLHVASAGLKLEILLPRCPKCWDYRCPPPCLTC